VSATKKSNDIYAYTNPHKQTQTIKYYLLALKLFFISVNTIFLVCRHQILYL